MNKFLLGLLLAATLALAVHAQPACDDVFTERKASLEEGGATVKQTSGDAQAALLAFYRDQAGDKAEAVDTVWVAAGNAKFITIMVRNDCIVAHSTPVSAAGLENTLNAGRKLRASE